MKESEKANIVHLMEQELKKQTGEEAVATYNEWVKELVSRNDGKPLTLEARGFLISTIVMADRLGKIANYDLRAATELGLYAQVVKGYILASEAAISIVNESLDTEKKN